MPREIILLPNAQSDLDTAYWWYEEQAPGLGEEFLRSVDAALTRISVFPQIYPVRFDEFCRTLIRRFPYAVYFDHDDKFVTVYGIFHGAQDPEKVASRLGK